MDETLRRLLGGQLRAAELPDPLDLDPLWQELAELCHLSLGATPQGLTTPLPFADGQVERGACILLSGGTARLEHWVKGGAGRLGP